ncbi:hypothetical protein TGAM01_v200823 [Trichoderma gamsii]|uniref:SEC7 domain-containing protein n=1 Tax=Trichoderma gamsii TaxID=398673 RepID=A0A2P5A1I4_9HYPO|nr:hypothetical protein TGAM01_v200823 [Trichoderma gamsii]PON30383.1 hypothetical protein TGAM01_v200823 [Trichoderma gamsii]
MQSNQRHQTTLPHRRAPVPKLSLVTSLASRPRSEVPHTTTTSLLAKPLILSDPNARRPELYSQQLRDLASTPPTVTATATRNVNASFLDDPTPIEPEMADQHASRALRDSHDLSLSPRNITRDSLVNNMLLSLDQFSLGQTTTTSPSGGLFGGKALTYDDPRPWANDTTFSRGRGANTTGRHHYSYSSDYDDDSTRTSVQIPRADDRNRSRRQRSNSSNSTFQAPFPTINNNNNPRDFTQRTHSGPAPNEYYSRARAGTKSSISTSGSTDAGYPQNIAGPSSSARGGFRRSASFDLGPPQMQTQPLMSPFHLDFPNHPVSDDYGAAPTPTIPGGPRRVPSNLAIPHTSSHLTEYQSLERSRSPVRSVKSSSGRTRRPVNNQLVAPAMALSDFDAAPAPSVSYGKSKAEQQMATSQSAGALSQPKERPGFFRRVFGSSKAAPVPAETPAPRLTNPVNSPAPPPKDIQPAPQSQPMLQKKPSSFFRRRKKSIVDEAPPLPGDVPPLPPLSADFDRPASPASSLRQIMNPYLKESALPAHPLGDITNRASTSAVEDDDDDDRAEFQRDFSPDYVPSPNAKIRAVQNSDSDQEKSSIDTDHRPSNGLKHRNNSFLDLDGGSDNDDSPIKQKATTSLAVDKENKNRDSTGTIRPKKPSYIGDQEKPNGGPVRPTVTIPTDAHRSTSFASASTDDGDYKTAPSTSGPPSASGNPSVRIERTSMSSPKGLGTLDLLKNRDLDEPEFVIGEPTEDDQQKAQQIYDGVEDFIPKEKAASWMGEEGPIRQRTLKAYIELYDFTDLSILSALRKVCGRLILRGETQQVDRILVAFSKRWCDCNPNHGFKATDVIHTICYSIMLLNTDLHMADIEQKMTRSQFVKNTSATITQAVEEAVPDAFERPSILPDRNSALHDGIRPSIDPQDKRSFRNSFRPQPRGEAQGGDAHDECGPLVKVAFYGSMKAWEEQIEVVLKSIYNSIRDDKLPLFGAEPERHLNTMPSQSSLSVMGMLKRSPSVLSKAPSESQMSTRGRLADNSRNPGSRWASKSRSRPGLGRNGFNSSRTSFDDANSLWSPAMSSATWSRYSLGRTQGSMSQDSFGSAVPRGDYQQSIGFANALSQAIVRDEDANGNDSMSLMSAEVPATQLLDDESLELAGPPWMKEGRVMHKHHLDGVGKRAKERNWTEVFAVIQRGQMSLFSFNAPKSTRQKSRTRNAEKANVVVGGGNWQDNAVSLGTFNLRLTLASALPSPGYSRSRPYVWALSLPTGAVHLFQVGTPEIIKEFVNTANYWSSRLSTHPLIGGISNIEYGWSDAIINNSLVGAANDNASILSGGRNSRPGSRANHGRQSSVASVTRPSSSMDHGSGAFTQSGGRGKLPGDRITIAEWAPPTQSMRPSNLPESEQLESLSTYVKSIEDDLQNHNQLRSPMLLTFTPRGSNANKAMANWERKSAYLLREIVKFRTYVEILQQSESRRKEIHKERDLARRAARGELNDGDMDLSEEEGDETLRP